MNYLYYRLLKQDHRWDIKTMLESSRHLKALAIPPDTWKVDAKDWSQILDFLPRLAEEADLDHMSEAQTFAILPSFLEGPPETQF